MQSEDLIAKTEKTSLEFKLKKAGQFAKHLTGTVLQPDSKPVANTVIGIATAAYGIQMCGTDFNSPGMQHKVKTDSAGKFAIARSEMNIGNQDYQLLFLHDTGTLRMRKEEFEKHTEPITLQAWGRIEGTVRAGYRSFRTVCPPRRKWSHRLTVGLKRRKGRRQLSKTGMPTKVLGGIWIG